MVFLRRLRLHIYLCWSLCIFAARIVLTMVAGQRALLAVTLLAVAIGLSATISHVLVVASAQELALTAPPAALVARSTTTSDNPILTSLQRSDAILLWEAYKKELLAHDRNRSLLTNLILLASALGLEKDAHLYQEKLFLTDPLLLCTFSNDSIGLLQINCDDSQFYKLDPT